MGLKENRRYFARISYKGPIVMFVIGGIIAMYAFIFMAIASVLPRETAAFMIAFAIIFLMAGGGLIAGGA